MIPTRFERVTHSLEGCCSIQLSYGTIKNLHAAPNNRNGVQIYGFFREYQLKLECVASEYCDVLLVEAEHRLLLSVQ